MGYIYETISSIKQKKLLDEYKLLFYRHTGRYITKNEFEKEKTRIQIKMCDYCIEHECKREAREAGILMAKAEL